MGNYFAQRIADFIFFLAVCLIALAGVIILSIAAEGRKQPTYEKTVILQEKHLRGDIWRVKERVFTFDNKTDSLLSEETRVLNQDRSDEE